ncbi:MAG: HD domain-containing protein [Nitrospiraceae bacterium]|nr:HD domain-containing protein [Nitrospiraceae bacterium]
MPLKTRMIGIIALVIIASIGLSTVIILNYQSSRLTEMNSENLRLMSKVIIKSMEDDMLRGYAGTELQRTIANISKNSEIKSLRIVSPDGYVLNSNNPAEIGYKSKDFIYTGALSEREPVVRGNAMILHTPIMNKPRCYICHSKQIKVNGVVEIKSDFSGTREEIASMRRFLVLLNLATVLAISLILSLLFAKNIVKPIKALVDTMRKVEGGDFDARVEINAQGEFGALADSFNRMIGQVKDLYEKNLKKERKINNARMELDHKRVLEELNGRLEFKVKEVETANKAILSLTRELKTKNLELEKMVERLKKISDIGRALSSIIEMEDLVRLVIRTASELFKAGSGYICVEKKDGERFVLQYHKGMGVESAIAPPETNPLYVKLINEGAGVFVRTADGDGGISSIGVPLKVKGRIIGGILLEKMDSSFTGDELEILSTMANQATVAIENAWLYESVKANYFGTIQALVNVLEANDKYTRGHSERVKTLSLMIGKRLGLNHQELELLEHAAILHDIGKIGVNSMVLNKNGRLTPAEFNMVKTHPLIGHDILGPVGILEGIRTTVLQHHERYDGTGYPNGIAGEEITLKARILSVADTFDAMMTDRPYRKAHAIQKVKDELQACSGTQFDPLVISAFIDMLDSGEQEILHSAGYSLVKSARKAGQAA